MAGLGSGVPEKDAVRVGEGLCVQRCAVSRPANAAGGIANVDLITPTGVMSTTLEIAAIAPRAG